MALIELREPFTSLPDDGLVGLVNSDGSINSFRLNTQFYEKEIAKRTGRVDISSSEELSNLDLVSDEAYRELVPFFVTSSGEPYLDILVQILGQHKDVEEPTAMLIKSTEELQAHALLVYQVANAHYVLGKKYDGVGPEWDFPSSSCGMSSMNMLVSLIAFGYSNALIVGRSNLEYDKAYNVLPFVFENDGNMTKGVLVSDPTSEQLWPKSEKNLQRNHVFVELGERWRYANPYKVNLFPDSILDLNLLKDMTSSLKEGVQEGDFGKYGIYCGSKYHKNVREFLDKAFSNPVEVKVPFIH